MAIVTPGFLGIIARKSERTQPFIERSHGEDFVATSSVDGVIDPMPEWLSMELGPPGWVPEPTTKVAPEVLAMWEKTRPQLYSLAPSPRLRCP